jgi:hypothetical protein
MRAMTFAAAMCAAIGPALAAPPGPPNYVDLQLVLAVDVSGSMDSVEQRVQRDGYVAAFRHPDVLRAIASGPYGAVAVTYIEWSGAFYQVVTVPWRIITSDEDSLAFADELARAPITREQRTSISGGLLFAQDAFRQSLVDSDRRTVDVSGDGANNDGKPVLPIRDTLLKEGVVINGLPILINPSPLYGGLTLDEYYRGCVIGGPGAFLIPVSDNSQFEIAIRRKLVLEIAGLPPRVVPVSEVAQSIAPTVDCLAGEKARQLGNQP